VIWGRQWIVNTSTVVVFTANLKAEKVLFGNPWLIDIVRATVCALVA
jgi:hypothetical protein